MIILAHPALLHIMGLGGDLVVRSSWAVYLQELHWAIATLKYYFYPRSTSPTSIQESLSKVPKRFYTSDPLTHFERKYLELDVPVYEYNVTLGIRSKEDRKFFAEAIKLVASKEQQADMELVQKNSHEIVRVVKNFASNL